MNYNNNKHCNNINETDKSCYLVETVLLELFEQKHSESQGNDRMSDTAGGHIQCLPFIMNEAVAADTIWVWSH